jgi:hypothetical protein
MPVNPKQFALYERDQRVKEPTAVFTYRRPPSGAKPSAKSNTKKGTKT